MNIWDILIVSVIAAAVASAVFIYIRASKRGKSCCGCSGGCAGCTACGRDSAGDRKKT